MNSATRRVSSALVVFLAAGAVLAQAQSLLHVTGISRPGGATFAAAGEEPRELFIGRSVGVGAVGVLDGAQVMLFEPSGIVAVVVGPATVGVSRDEATGVVRLELREGKLILVAAPDGAPRQVTVTVVASEQPRVVTELPVGPGETTVVRTADQFGITYAGAPGAISVRVNDAPVAVPAGALLTLDTAGQPQVGPVGDWLAGQGLTQPWGQVLGVASAHASRGDVEIRLFTNIITWDRYAGATYVSARLREYRFTPEIRQSVQTVTTFSRQTNAGGTVQTEPFNAANEVPALSPAAAAVQNIHGVGQGVTAIDLNSIAAGLLRATGSQGLGFRGLRQLALPGFFGPGFRTPGPSGLGAE